MTNSVTGILTKGVVVVGFILFAFIIGFVIALPIMWLWNWLMPVIFGLTVITYWQAWGLFVLSSLLLKSSSGSS